MVEAADEITVKLTDKREFKAKVIGADRRTDVALIKIDATSLPAVRFGDPNKLRVGEWVLAIGSPFGFENTVTAGIVSAKGRSLPQENYVPFIQTDVAVNPGNSGGPLFNLRGEVVGINSQIYSRTGGFMGLSFAIPIDVANDIAKQLRTTGKVTRGRIGVVIQAITKELADGFGLPEPQGALVNSVEKGGPADKAGVEPGDVILRFDGKAVASSEDLPRIVGATRPGRQGDDADLAQQEHARRAGGGGRNAGRTRGAAGAARRQAAGGGAEPVRADAVRPDRRAEERSSRFPAACWSRTCRARAQRAGVRRGDVILAVNNQDVKSVEQFNQMMGQFDKGRIVALLVRRGTNSLLRSALQLTARHCGTADPPPCEDDGAAFIAGRLMAIVTDLR